MSDEIPPEEVWKWLEKGEDRWGRRVIAKGDKLAYLDRVLTSQLDYASLIKMQIQNCVIAGMYSEEAFNRNVAILVAMIPDKDMDEQFREDIKNAKELVWRGTPAHGIEKLYAPQPKLIYKVNFAKVFKACINLFRRRGILWQEAQQEVFW